MMVPPRGAIFAEIDVSMTSKSFDALPVELIHNIACLLESDKDLVSFRSVCHATHDAVEADGGSFWRRRFMQAFETPSFKLTGHRKEDAEKFRIEYQTRKSALHIVDPVFQTHGVKPKLKFDMGTTRVEKTALRILKDLINDSFGDKKDATDTAYDSKNMEHILDLVNKTNLLQITGLDVLKRSSDPHATSFLYAIQCILVAEFLSINEWHYEYQYGFYYAQISAYANNITAPIFTGQQRFNIDMHWLLRNLQFWRHHFLVKDEPLAPAFEALDDSERPQFWDSKLSGARCQLGSYWKGSYAFLDRAEVKNIRLGRSGQRGHPHIADQLNGEDDPFGEAFQSLELAACDPAHNSEWPNRFEKILHSREMPAVTSAAVTRAQHRGHGINADRDFHENSIRFEGDGSDNDESFFVGGWLNPLPSQHGIPGWARMTMMKYFIDEDSGAVDIPGLWAYEGVMLPGGKIMVGRWWCPQDGVGANMYSGPFILWNVDGSVDEEDDECIGCDRAPKNSA